MANEAVAAERGRLGGLGLAAVLVVGLVAVLGGVMVLALRAESDPGPVATGRTGDACAASGPVGVVGVDLRSGRVRWANVVGEEPVGLWPTRAEPQPGTVDVRGEGGTIRSVDVGTGAVTSCRPATDPRPPPVPAPDLVDDSGAVARRIPSGPLELLEADGSVRWSVQDRYVVGVSSAAVVVETAIPFDEPRPADPVLEVLDPATGTVLWEAPAPTSGVAVTEKHLVTISGGVTDHDPSAGGPYPAGFVVAHDLADGSEAWRVDLDPQVQVLGEQDGLVLVIVGGGMPDVVALEGSTGAVRWRAELPNPGRGGEWSERHGAPGRFVVLDDTVVIVVTAQVPRRD